MLLSAVSCGEEVECSTDYLSSIHAGSSAGPTRTRRSSTQQTAHKMDDSTVPELI